MFLFPRQFFRHFLLVLLGTGLAWGSEQPRVVVFAGNPGNEEHHATYENLLGQLSKALTERFGISSDRLTVYYGPQTAGYAGPATRETILTALGQLREQSEAGDHSPIWLILLGHANKIKGGALFNLPGPDLSYRDLGRQVAKFSDDVPVVLWGTTTMSHPLLRSARGPNRVVVSATGAKDPENETEFPLGFLAALQEDATDANSDGRVTVPELFLATRAKVRETYEANNFIIKEQAQLDGDGNGRGTSRPARSDAAGANRFFLNLTKQNSDFD